MSTLVECVPNFSEGRDKAKVDAIVAAMKMDGVYLLDCEMDADHNRCVITLVGERELIQEAAIRGVGKAAELIDLNVHQGAHPRMGAADVVPFIPIEGGRMKVSGLLPGHVANRFGSAIRFRFICTRRLRQSRSDRIWRVSVAASLRAFVPRSPQFLQGSRTSATLECIRRRARRW